MMNRNLQTIWLSARPPFLVLAPACVLLGFSCALFNGYSPNVFHAVLVFSASILAHVSVNAFNEYMDYRSGLDLLTEKTPFSGGSGGLVQNPLALKGVLGLAIISLVLTIIIGVYFVQLRGLGLLALGALGVLLVVCYTPWINHSPILCWAAPGLGFGTVMVLGTYLALTGEVDQSAVMVSFIPFFLANNLLLLNQFPDIEADSATGRRHLVVVYGKSVALLVYGVSVLLAALLIFYGGVSGSLPWLSMIAIVPLLLTANVIKGLYSNLRESQAKWLPYLGKNVMVTLTVPSILALSLWIAS